MSSTKWPNVLLVDYIGVIINDQFAWYQLSAELYTLAIGLNLYILSENCDVSDQHSPILPSAASMARVVRKCASPSWNDVVFANGTAVYNLLQSLHLSRVEMLKNGTVLSEDIPNSDWN
jgi:hypothetical protein